MADRTVVGPRASELIRAVGMVLVEAIMLAVLWAAGPILGSVSLDHFGSWMHTTAPTDALTALIRLGGMVIAVWLLATTLLYVVAGLLGAEGLMRRSRWATLPIVRRMAEGLSAASILASLATAAGGGAGVSSAAPGTRIVTERPVTPPRPVPQDHTDRLSLDRPARPGPAEVSDRTVGRHLPHPGSLEHILPVSYSTPVPSAPSAADDFTGIAPGTKVYVVKPGDCLSVVAQDHLGDWRLDAEIHQLNIGRVQRDGRSLTDDHWIYPGWVLVMPADAVGVQVVPSPAVNARPDPTVHDHSSPAIHPPASGVTDTTGRSAAEPTHPVAAQRAPSGRHSSKPAPASNTRPNTTSASPAPREPAPMLANGHGPGRPASTFPKDQHGTNGTNSHDRHKAGESPIGPEVGVAGLVAAGVIWQLERRRRRQMHFRRTGRTVTPNPASMAGAETTARAIADDEAMRWVEAGLRLVGSQLADRDATADTDDERSSPSIVLVRAGSRGLELMIAPTCPDAPEGWTVVDEGAVWALNPDIDLEDLEARTRQGWSFLPALVTVGTTIDGTVLANLEHAGSLAVDGDPESVRAVLTQMLVELTSQPWADNMLRGLYATGDPKPPNLEGVSTRDDAMALAEQLDYAADEQTAALAAFPSVALRRAIECEWLPQVAVAFAGTDPEALRCLVEAASPDKSGVAVVAAGPVSGARWQLTLDGSGQSTLAGMAGDRPFRLPVDVQVRAETVDLLAGALAAAADEADAPPPVTSICESVQPGPVEIKLLGPVSVLNGPPPPEPRRQAGALAVLTYLATHSQPVTADELTSALWPLNYADELVEEGPSRKTVLNVISRARSQLGTSEHGEQRISYDVTGYRLAPEVTTDWGRFQRLTALAAKENTPASLELCRQALELVDGPPFGGMVHHEFFAWVRSEHLDFAIIATVVDAAEALGGLALQYGDFDTVTWAVEKGLALDPAREQLYQLWMHALGRSGRSDLVADIYRRLCSILQERIEPGMVPTPESESIWRSYLTAETSRI